MQQDPPARRPAVAVLDVNETLSDLAPMGQAFVDAGAPAHLAQLWFACVLRDGFGLAAAGAEQPFARVAEGVLRPLLAGAGVPGDGPLQRVMSAFTSLDVHPDVPDGLRSMRRAGIRLVTLTNGSTQVSEDLLGRAGVRDEVEQLISVEDAGAWKPARRAYEHAARSCGVDTADMLLVAVHPWDIDGAARAGLRTAWLDRSGTPYPAHLTPPELTATDVADLAEQLEKLQA